jgi:hypothetical protein
VSKALNRKKVERRKKKLEVGREENTTKSSRWEMLRT